MGNNNTCCAFPSAQNTINLASGTISQITSGRMYYCALFTNSTVQCWGVIPSSSSSVAVPTTVSGFQSGTITSISAGVFHACALFSDSTVQCWGSNSYGELGNNSTTASLTPVSVTGLAAGTISSVSAGKNNTCAVFSNNTIQCWGVNGSGQLGNNSVVNSLTPVSVTGLPAGTISQIVSTSSGYCVLFSNATVQCWGRNDVGQLGDNTTTDSKVPVNVIF
jgi:alpha-tubulin suppressor-like RCC1 family protein